MLVHCHNAVADVTANVKSYIQLLQYSSRVRHFSEIAKSSRKEHECRSRVRCYRAKEGAATVHWKKHLDSAVSD